MNGDDQNYKWYILALVALTNMFVIAIPTMGMSVLAKEIADDLNLNLVQVGVIWGVGALLGIVTSLLGGMLGDKFGPKRVLVAGVLLGGLLGAVRGLADSFAVMTVLMLLLGAATPIVLINSFKVLGQWFPQQQLGLANGVNSMSMALGFMIGSLVSATVFSPLLGGWSNVLIVYGLAGAAFSIPWMFSRTSATHPSAGESPSVRKALRHVIGLKSVWLLALGLLGVGGAIQGMLGYLPLYLRAEGWPPIQADGALFAFHTASMILVLPVSLWSDRLKFRKPLLLVTNLLIISGLTLLGVASGGMVWVAVLLSGSVRDTFMAIFTTMAIEAEHVGPLYAGTAVGFAFALGNLGNLIAPPIGNSLATLGPAAPFAFWSLLAVFGFVCLSFVKEKGRDTDRVLAQPASVPLRTDV